VYVKHILRESREKLFSSLESDIKNNPKRFWSLLEETSKSRSIPDLISMATATGAATNSVTLHPRTTADSSAGIANLFNSYFASVFTSRGFHMGVVVSLPLHLNFGMLSLLF
jgi:hypothetical protein